MRMLLALSVWAVWTCLAGRSPRPQFEPATAEEKAALAEPGGPKLGEPQVQRWRIGMIVTAVGGPCGHMTGARTVPMDWPEQRVKVVAQDLSPGATVSYKTYKNTARQMVVSFPAVAAGEEARAVLTFELTRRAIGPPESPAAYVVPDPKKLPGNLKEYLGPSPFIESGHPRVKALAKEIGAGETSAWQRVKAIYNWVDDHLKYVPKNKGRYELETHFTGVVEAIDKGRRLQRTDVDVHRHLPRRRRSGAHDRVAHALLPEFYLQDGRGQGYWFPCEEMFGRVAQQAPILQEGRQLRLPAADPAGKRGKTEKRTASSRKPSSACRRPATGNRK